MSTQRKKISRFLTVCGMFDTVYTNTVPSLVQVAQLHTVGCDQGPGVAPEGGGLVHQVPESVPVHNDGDVERHDLLEDEGDAAQHGLVLAEPGPHHHAVHAGQPGVNLWREA